MKSQKWSHNKPSYDPIKISQTNPLDHHISPKKSAITYQGIPSPCPRWYLGQVDPRSEPCRRGAALSAEIFGWTHAAVALAQDQGDVLGKVGDAAAKPNDFLGNLWDNLDFMPENCYFSPDLIMSNQQNLGKMFGTHWGSWKKLEELIFFQQNLGRSCLENISDW